MTSEPTLITRGTASQASDVFAAAEMSAASEEVSEGLADGELCLVAWLGEEVAGAAVGRPDSLAFDDAGHEYLYAVLEWLAVLPEHRGLDIGTDLLEAFCKLSCDLGARTVHLRMPPSRINELQGFYGARGFSEAATATGRALAVRQSAATVAGFPAIVATPPPRTGASAFEDFSICGSGPTRAAAERCSRRGSRVRHSAA